MKKVELKIEAIKCATEFFKGHYRIDGKAFVATSKAIYDFLSGDLLEDVESVKLTKELIELECGECKSLYYVPTQKIDGKNYDSVSCPFCRCTEKKIIQKLEVTED